MLIAQSSVGDNYRPLNLRGANLRGANLSGADLSGANFSKADLREANLEGANLSAAFLANADLSGANLKGATFEGSILERADLSNATLNEADFTDANMEHAILVKISAVDCDFTRADLSQTQLEYGELTRANFFKANLSGAEVLWGERGAEEQVGELTIDVPRPNIVQSMFRAMERVPFLRQFFSPTIIWGALPFLWRGFQVAVLILAVSYSLGIPLGLALAFMKMARWRIVRWPATAYIDVVRGTPLLVQLLLVYFGITFVPGWSELINALGPLANWRWHNVEATQFFRVFIVLSFNSAAYMAEIFRAGIQSIHKGQLEAARSLGMTWPKSMAFIIIPQTVRRILPTMMSEFILLFKDTSILFAVGIFEITLQARTIQAAKFNMSPYIAAAGFYLMLTLPLGRLVANLEERLSVAETGRAREPKKPGRMRTYMTSRRGRGAHIDNLEDRTEVSDR